MSRVLVIGDMHGGHKAFLQCLERSKFDKEKDTLICLGDVADGWPEVKECFNELLTLKNLIFILGNHDQWLHKWSVGYHPGKIWTSQGGAATQASYNFNENIPKAHKELLESAKLYYVDEQNRLFVHGGYNWHKPIRETEDDDFLWDRELIKRAVQNEFIAKRQDIEAKNLTPYTNVFVGHTTVTCFKDTQRILGFPEFSPIKACEVWGLDTGGGYEGKLTIMDVDTKEYWQSDIVKTLYPNHEHR